MGRRIFWLNVASVASAVWMYWAGTPTVDPNRYATGPLPQCELLGGRVVQVSVPASTGTDGGPTVVPTFIRESGAPRAGEGAALVVFVAGAACPATMWARVQAALPQHRSAAYDRPGIACTPFAVSSEASASVVTASHPIRDDDRHVVTPFMCRHLLGVIDALLANDARKQSAPAQRRRVVLVGHSLGGLVAVACGRYVERELATRHATLAGVVLADSVSPGHSAGAAFRRACPLLAGFMARWSGWGLLSRYEVSIFQPQNLPGDLATHTAALMQEPRHWAGFYEEARWVGPLGDVATRDDAIFDAPVVLTRAARFSPTRKEAVQRELLARSRAPPAAAGEGAESHDGGVVPDSDHMSLLTTEGPARAVAAVIDKLLSSG